MKKKIIDNKIYHQLDETTFNKLKKNNGNSNENFIFETKNEENKDFIFEEKDLDCGCDSEDEIKALDKIVFDEKDKTNGCDILEDNSEDDSVDSEEFIFEMKYKTDNKCVEEVERLAKKLTDIVELKKDLVLELGNLESEYWHFRLVGSLFEYIRDFHKDFETNKNIPEKWNIRVKLSSKKLHLVFGKIKKDLENNSNFLKIINVKLRNQIRINFKENEIPESGNIYRYYDEINKYVSDLSEDEIKQTNSTDIINKKILDLRLKFIENPGLKLLERYKEYAREIAISDIKISGGDLDKYINQETVLNDYNEYLRIWKSIEKKYLSKSFALEKLEEDIIDLRYKLENIFCKQSITKKTDIKPGENLEDFDWNVSDLSIPTINDYLYWLRYCGIATIVNLIPIYWPVGILIPNPSGVTKIPFPIVWIPIAVFTTPLGLMVILIGQCGMIPSPFIFFWNTSGSDNIIKSLESKFLISLRGSQDIKKDSGNNIIMSSLPHFDFENQINKMPDSIPNPNGIINLLKDGLTNLKPEAQVFPKGLLIPTQDDFPVWERLSIDNILLLNYLKDFCQAGKNGGGFFKDA